MTRAPDDLRYPIGAFAPPGTLTPEQVNTWIGEIAALPRAVTPLSENQLDTPYRPGGWTVRQVVHHLPDSHLNSLIRFKWALTEDRPTIKAYDEKGWAELPDYTTVPSRTRWICSTPCTSAGWGCSAVSAGPSCSASSSIPSRDWLRSRRRSARMPGMAGIIWLTSSA